MDVQIKICGLSTEETIKTAIENGADFIGFIFFAKSPRHLTLEKAASLRKYIKPPVKLVAVVVDAENDVLDALLKTVKPDLLQLHGNETKERVIAIKNRYNLPIIKAFAIKDQNDFDKIAEYVDLCSFILLDAKAPDGAEVPGGNGISFDWSLLKNSPYLNKIMLSGGLNAHNVAKALSMAPIAAIDVSSGVEEAPGVKNNGLIQDFFTKAKDANKNSKKAK